MLSQPEQQWVARNFEKEFNVGKSRAAYVLSALRKNGFVGGKASGRTAYNMLLNPQGLLDEWTKHYSFGMNRVFLYYSPIKNLLSKIREYFNTKSLIEKYFLTMHTGANLITNYVNTDNIYFYLNCEKFNEVLLDLRQSLGLKELKRGGNVFIFKPYYKESISINKQRLKGFNVVSNLQLYLDLFSFPQRGKEHAQYLIKTLQEKGVNLA
jgi:hypothetical protein